MFDTASSVLEKYANHLAVFLTLIAVGVAASIIMPLFRKPLDVKGKVSPSFSTRGTEIWEAEH
jgi:hypothetical protein